MGERLTFLLGMVQIGNPDMGPTRLDINGVSKARKVLGSNFTKYYRMECLGYALRHYILSETEYLDCMHNFGDLTLYEFANSLKYEFARSLLQFLP